MVTVDLNGPDGNVFALMGLAKSFARQMGIPHASIVQDMMSGDYDHAVEVMENYFGDVATFER